MKWLIRLFWRIRWWIELDVLRKAKIPPFKNMVSYRVTYGVTYVDPDAKFRVIDKDASHT